MIAVVDTSALIELFTVDTLELDTSLTERLGHVIPHVPDIIDVEFHHALRGLVLGNEISPSRAEQARVLFTDTPKIRYPSCELTQRIWSLRRNLGAYDACFIALAEALEAPMITCDEKQAGASGHRAQIEAFSNG